MIQATGGRIPESFIDELMNRVDIVEVIQRRVDLKRAGSEFKACCPFHEEKTASFTVSPRKQFYHCFGCGQHGTAIGFLMAFEGLEFVDAVETLAQSLGLEVPREGGHAGTRVTPDLYDTMEAAKSWFIERLKASPEAIAYLKQRGINGETAREFSIGYAPDSWDAIIKKLGNDEAGLKRLEKTGMLSRGDKGVYDKFRDRIMFPIHDRRGRVIGFGGRAMADKGPKYLNSPETELFHKGQELYGLYLARKRDHQLNRLLVVEGYTDVVALAQFGLGYAVATLGTATTPDQAELLFRNASEVVFCFDGDKAGRKAAWRALESTLPKLREGRQARFLFLPDGEDPDSLIRQEGLEAFTARVDSAQALSAFFFGELEQQTDMNSVEGRARLVELARPYLAQLTSGMLSDMLNQELSQRAKHDVSVRANIRPLVKTRSNAGSTTMRRAIALLLQMPELAQHMPDWAVLEDAQIPGLDLLRELIEFCAERPNITTAKLLEHWRDRAAGKHLGQLVVQDLKLDESNVEQYWFEALRSICREINRQQLEQISEAQRQGLMSEAEKDKLRRLLQTKQDLKDLSGEM